MAALSGKTPDDMLDEYGDEYAVYRIDDGERHWYVADDFIDAIREHVSIMGPFETEEFTIRRLPGDQEVSLHCECEDDTREFAKASQFAIVPPVITAENYEQNHSWKVVGTAAGWACYYSAGHATQICSSCFP